MCSQASRTLHILTSISSFNTIPTCGHLVTLIYFAQAGEPYYIGIRRTDAIFLDFQHKSDRGPHVYWLSKGTLDARPDHILNLIHYEVRAAIFVCVGIITWMSVM